MNDSSAQHSAISHQRFRQSTTSADRVHLSDSPTLTLQAIRHTLASRRWMSVRPMVLQLDMPPTRATPHGVKASLRYKIWHMYKKAEATFWTAEMDLTKDLDHDLIGKACLTLCQLAC
ncbi:hypothetical protein BC827DRAFT_732387 [Russula dissimulans]|nr:hypothetical protein BC827DRAFT_732387 [Russula dissimulans]